MTAPNANTVPQILSRVALDGECWLWTGNLDSHGYGRVRFGGRRHKAHRFFFEAIVGPIPDGLVIDHLCRRRSCCNPDHMEPVTQEENVSRGYWGLRTECANGHAYTPDNTARDASGGRLCRKCIRAKSRRAWARKQVAA